MRLNGLSFAGAVAVVALAACAPKSAAPAAPLTKSGWASAAAPLINTAGKTVGEVAFRDAPAGVLIRVRVSGLTPGWHGVHLHQIADCSDAAAGFKASAGHVNANGEEHGLDNPKGAETGDLPNLYAGADGQATAEFFRQGVALKPSEEKAAEFGINPLLDADGFAVVIHESEDDELSQPIGGAGKRVTCAAVKG